MSRLRSAYLAVALLLGLPVLLFFGAARFVNAQLPAPQGDRIRGPHGLVGVQSAAGGAWSLPTSGSSYAWVIPSDTGVIVVDAGLDPAARALLHEIGPREVRAILVTHGHIDRVAGLAAFPDVPIWADDPAIAMIRGEERPEGWLARAMAAASAPAAPQGNLTSIGDIPDPVGGVLEIDGERFHVVRVPGHAVGNVAWLWEGVLFTGDAVLGGSPLRLSPPALSDDPALAEKSLERLLLLDFDTIADAHTGLTSAARPALFRLADQPLVPPTVTVTTRADAEGARSRSVAAVRGILVRTPVPDMRGEQPDLLVTAEGDVWRLSDRPDPEHTRWVGQRLVVEGHPLPTGAGPGIPLVVTAIRAEPDPPVADRPLNERIGEIVSVTGTVTGFRPLTAQAAWGEGTILLGDEDPQTLSLSAPIATVAGGGPVRLDARVVRDSRGQVRLVALPLTRTEGSSTGGTIAAPPRGASGSPEDTAPTRR